MEDNEAGRIIPLLEEGPSVANQRPMSVTDLILQCNAAASKMSMSNDNRILIMNCAYAMRQLVDRLAFHEGQGKVS